MREKIKKLKQKINNSGSGVILVIVALTFIGVLVGALLSAVGYAYRLKLYDYNARDNFYYVEQAMNEVYAGVGTATVDNMQKAYDYTVENMVEFDLARGEYVNIGNAAANDMFDEKFIESVASDPFFTTGLADSLEACISNPSVKLDRSRIRLSRYDEDGNMWVEGSGYELAKVVIENVTLTRTAEYNRSTANGSFTQTISTDIEISKPDFLVEFNNANPENKEIFNYALIADSGVEIHQDMSVPLTIKGNVYAAADFYNKDYNYSGAAGEDWINYDLETFSAWPYKVNQVSSAYGITDDALFNQNYYLKTMGESSIGIRLPYDGVNELSRYSGLYIDHSDVSIMADNIIVPGTIAVLNTGKFSAYSKAGNTIVSSNIWTDNLVLDGYSSTIPLTTPDSKGHTNVITGAEATLRANLYVKDDTELNAAGSKFVLNGNYYGFGNSTVADDRSFINPVDLTAYRYKDGNNTFARGHYNSSAIVVNGERSTIDLTNANNIFLAGRTYVEVSKTITSTPVDGVITGYNNGQPIVETVKVETYTYDQETKDYKTGESLSVKSNQVAYIPVNYKTLPEEKTDANGKTYYVATLPTALRDSDLFVKHFGQTDEISCICVTVSGKKFYYYDFERTWNRRSNAEGQTFTNAFNTAEALAESFITDYVAELNNKYSPVKEYLTDISKYEDFEPGTIRLPNAAASNMYSSGAMTSIEDNPNSDLLTVLDGVEFNIAAQKDIDITSILKNGGSNPNKHPSTSTTTQALDLQALDYSTNFEKHYNYVKFCLEDLTVGSAEANFVDGFVAKANYGNQAITPINRFMNFDKINDLTAINPAFSSDDNGGTILNLVSGDKVWVSSGNITIKANADDSLSATMEDGHVSGIVIAKGDVFFGKSVRKFEGLIIAGGKVYINNYCTEISANSQLCKKILSQCQLDGSDNAKFLLSLFKGYEDTALEREEGQSGARKIDTIDYTDVVRYNNWMKNVE